MKLHGMPIRIKKQHYGITAKFAPMKSDRGSKVLGTLDCISSELNVKDLA